MVSRTACRKRTTPLVDARAGLIQGFIYGLQLDLLYFDFFIWYVIYETVEDGR